MKIHNFRVGFATNSSSSHSVILLPPRLVGKIRPIASEYENEFGWDHFRLVSEESKLRYLAAQFFCNYADDETALPDFISLIDQEIPGYAEEMQETINQLIAAKGDGCALSRCGSLPSVDHQSVLAFPKQYNSELAASIIQYFKSPRVVVLGGNDNADVHNNRVADAKEVEFFNELQDRSRNFKTKKDGNYWIIFDSFDGTKIRLSFGLDDLSAQDYQKSTFPELIDLKLTGKCGARCQFCYMSSTPEGIHASFERIESIAKMLAEMDVFEVALGGGEPTSHPDFARILRLFHEHDIVPNFTTFSDAWLDDMTILDAVGKYVGGIGVSCLDEKGLTLVSKIKEKVAGYERRPRVSAQHVVGSVPIDITVDFIKTAFEKYIPVLLLGFKEIGFGATYQRFDDKSFETYLKLAIGELEWSQLSVDTALINRYPNLPAILGAPDALVTAREGAFSCYIDATTNRCGASSYVPETDMLPLPNTIEDFQAIFKEF